jgi:hypothetical protein
MILRSGLVMSWMGNKTKYGWEIKKESKDRLMSEPRYDWRGKKGKKGKKGRKGNGGDGMRGWMVLGWVKEL